MKRRLFAAVLAASLLSPGTFWAGQNNGANAPASPPAATSQQASGQEQYPRPARTRSRARRRSYQRETNPRRRPRISKQEWAFMAAIAGTSMGIGAIAAGGEGLAIGAIVGGWGAYAGHRLWKWIK